jgi:hypothetical protein
VVKLQETAMAPYRTTGESEESGNRPAAYLYATVRPGVTGSLEGAKDAAVNEQMAATFAYPSLDFVFSAASRLVAEGSSANTADSATKALSQVTRINAHVRVESLDSSHKPLSLGKDSAPVLVLMIAPEDVSFAQSGSSRAADIATGVEFAARFMGPIGGLVSAFQSSHKAARSPAEIAYQSSDNEFGWTWYESSDSPIEGLHRCAALLEVPLKTAFLRVGVDLITDWRHFGAWTKTFQFEVPVLPAPKK